MQSNECVKHGINNDHYGENFQFGKSFIVKDEDDKRSSALSATGEKPQFDLESILRGSTGKLRKISKEAERYLFSLTTNRLQSRLTSNEALEIAEALLDKIEKKGKSRRK